MRLANCLFLTTLYSVTSFFLKLERFNNYNFNQNEELGLQIGNCVKCGID